MRFEMVLSIGENGNEGKEILDLRNRSLPEEIRGIRCYLWNEMVIPDSVSLFTGLFFCCGLLCFRGDFPQAICSGSENNLFNYWNKIIKNN